MSSQSGHPQRLAVRVTLAAAIAYILFFSWPVHTSAATDPCTALKPEEISKEFGETFGPPTRQSTPAGRLAGASATCTYESKNLTFKVNSYEYLSDASRAKSWEVRRDRLLAAKHTVEISGVGEGGLYMRDSLQSYQGIHEYWFSAQPKGAAAYKVDRKDHIIAIAKLFYSRPH
jgi:hypothetical protein